jgi:hypothetical protein
MKGNLKGDRIQSHIKGKASSYMYEEKKALERFSLIRQTFG